MLSFAQSLSVPAWFPQRQTTSKSLALSTRCRPLQCRVGQGCLIKPWVVAGLAVRPSGSAVGHGHHARSHSAAIRPRSKQWSLGGALLGRRLRRPPAIMNVPWDPSYRLLGIRLDGGRRPGWRKGGRGECMRRGGAELSQAAQEHGGDRLTPLSSGGDGGDASQCKRSLVDNRSLFSTSQTPRTPSVLLPVGPRGAESLSHVQRL
jgi:hypothetical protein